MSEREPGPPVVWLVRHGESMGNVADAHAQRAGSGRLKLDVRDPDVPLSDTGRAQAEALGTWLAELPEDERPTAVLSSPFNRPSPPPSWRRRSSASPCAPTNGCASATSAPSTA